MAIKLREFGNMPDYYESTHDGMTKGDLVKALRCVGRDAKIFIEAWDRLCRIKYVEKIQDEGPDEPAFINLIPDDEEVLECIGYAGSQAG